MAGTFGLGVLFAYSQARGILLRQNKGRARGCISITGLGRGSPCHEQRHPKWRGKRSTAVGDKNESRLGSAARTGEAKGVSEDPAEGTQSANERPGPTLRISVWGSAATRPRYRGSNLVNGGSAG
jgi:hypothetical protein